MHYTLYIPTIMSNDRGNGYIIYAGVESALLKWARDFSKENGAKFISLEVMRKNMGAIRLNERKGYVIQLDPPAGMCDFLCAPCFVFCCFGCVYFRV